MAIYARFLAQTDKAFDRLTDTVKDTGQWDNTFPTGISYV
jgi:arylsulfatase A-like enzyme